MRKTYSLFSSPAQCVGKKPHVYIANQCSLLNPILSPIAFSLWHDSNTKTHRCSNPCHYLKKLTGWLWPSRFSICSTTTIIWQTMPQLREQGRKRHQGLEEGNNTCGSPRRQVVQRKWCPAASERRRSVRTVPKRQESRNRGDWRSQRTGTHAIWRLGEKRTGYWLLKVFTCVARQTTFWDVCFGRPQPKWETVVWEATSTNLQKDIPPDSHDPTAAKRIWGLWTAEIYGDSNSRSNCVSPSGRMLMFAQFSLSGWLNSW